MTIPLAEKIKVWVRAGGRCALCNCYLLEGELTAKEVALGEDAHIVGQLAKLGSPRGLADLPEEERDKAENILLACPTCHAEIDKTIALDVMTIDKLRALKKEHEDRVIHATGLAWDRRTTVLRMAGKVRGQVCQVTREAAAAAILRSSDRFPFFSLSQDRQGFEIDLGGLPGEAGGGELYYAAATARIDEVVEHKLHEGVSKNEISRLSVFAFARLPLLVYLGSKLDDTIATDVYQRHRADETWAWPEDAVALNFSWDLVAGERGSEEARLVMNVSGTVQLDELPESGRDSPTYLLTPHGVDPHPDALRSRQSLRGFGEACRGLFAELEATNKSVKRLHVFAALPVSAAVTLGRVRDPAVHPTLVLYDRTPDGYHPVLEV